MFKPLLAALALFAAGPAHPVKIIPGAIPEDRQPDGNTVIFEDAKGLIVVDTGRHKEHQAAILDYARSRGKPIVAIVNTHWHLDHSGGNQELRAVFPDAKLYTSTAIEGALGGFLSAGRGRERLKDSRLSANERTDIALGVEAIEDRKDLIPDVPVTGDTRIGRLELHLAPFAATQGDTWLYDPESRTLVAGDLVVIPVPFFDTACAAGWRKALDALAAQPFERLVPGHGPALDRPEFEAYRSAFANLVDCAAGAADKAQCVAGWQRDAAQFLTTARDRTMSAEYLGYYIDNILREPGKQAQLCSRAP